MLRKPVVLITGASGEIGHGLIDRLAEQGRDRILALDLHAPEDTLRAKCYRFITGDIAETALLENLDLLITVDTMAAHLAGALGKAVWMLLPYEADWRWMLKRADSPWYPTMRLFRQPSRGDWRSVFAEMATRLAERMP